MSVAAVAAVLAERDESAAELSMLRSLAYELVAACDRALTEQPRHEVPKAARAIPKLIEGVRNAVKSLDVAIAGSGPSGRSCGT